MPADFKTLQFPNTARGQAEKVKSLRQESAAGWEVVSESVTAGKFKGGDACCLFLICAPCAFLAGTTDGEITVTLRRTSGQATGPSGVKNSEAAVQHDPLLRDAAELAIRLGYGNAGLFQREMKLGYGRAARLVQELEDAGIIEQESGLIKRDVALTPDELDRIIGTG
jgi:DNA segregation ATPase FtsK/SpoIIIE-like protein